MFLPFEMIWQGEYENVQFALCNDYGLFHLWWRNQKKYIYMTKMGQNGLVNVTFK